MVLRGVPIHNYKMAKDLPVETRLVFRQLLSRTPWPPAIRPG
jgi:hypothetical protein